MSNKFEQALIDENRELRETIRELTRENIANEKYLIEFSLKMYQKGLQEGSAA